MCTSSTPTGFALLFLAGLAASASCKRGVAYSFKKQADIAAISSASWWYNWATKPDPGMENTGVEFVPMVWGGDFDVDKVASEIPKGSKYLLGFNEPNFKDQSHMTAETAAKRWKDVEKVAEKAGIEVLVGPAVNWSPNPEFGRDPVLYVKDFLGNCTGCRVDAIAVHNYMCYPVNVRNYVSSFFVFNKPIWLTEFACGEDGRKTDPERQKDYMTSVNWLESQPNVARYAWFSARSTELPPSNLLTAQDGQLTELGNLYNSFAGAPANRRQGAADTDVCDLALEESRTCCPDDVSASADLLDDTADAEALLL
eukprot:m51a1_g5310 hypothetical protein (312) ;mRNA; f:284926-286975